MSNMPPPMPIRARTQHCWATALRSAMMFLLASPAAAYAHCTVVNNKGALTEPDVERDYKT